VVLVQTTSDVRKGESATFQKWQLENTYLENGQLENGQLENEEYSTWPSPEGAFSI